MSRQGYSCRIIKREEQLRRVTYRLPWSPVLPKPEAENIAPPCVNVVSLILIEYSSMKSSVERSWLLLPGDLGAPLGLFGDLGQLPVALFVEEAGGLWGLQTMQGALGQRPLCFPLALPVILLRGPAAQTIANDELENVEREVGDEAVEPNDPSPPPSDALHPRKAP
ncbi:hypothetical protein B296_00033279 [Ensete ventricosum]|uniref:Uncharacterized protein n=1 Tax=Ensete ventricosum TaxID=4639 RepID=A0A426Y622_ENSVE|nr:hypothetical protein B296_00033279 [Ensete ventricosum]